MKTRKALYTAGAYTIWAEGGYYVIMRENHVIDGEVYDNLALARLSAGHWNSYGVKKVF